MKETELKPCPFCGNTDIDMWPMSGFELPICNQCGANICENYLIGPDTKKQIQAWNTRDQQPHLCKCRNDEDGAITVKRINDDFHQCPRCGGLIPVGYVRKDRIELDVEKLCKIMGEFNKEPSHLYLLLAKAIAENAKDVVK